LAFFQSMFLYALHRLVVGEAVSPSPEDIA